MNNATTTPFLLYGQNLSYFTAKVRCALRAKSIWFEEIHSDFSEVIRRTGMGFIPILVTPENETWQDSSDIMDRLDARFLQPALLPNSPRHQMVALLIDLYVDEFGLLPAMAWRWGTDARRKSSSQYFSAVFGQMGLKAAEAMIARTADVGVISSTLPVIEAHTHDLLAALNTHFETHPYLLGERISYADCALMGLLYGHLFNDHESRGVLLETAPSVVGWIVRCNAPAAHRDEQWFEDDALPTSLIEVLQVMAADGLPLILECANVAGAWAESAPDGSKVPGSVGLATAKVRGTTVERKAVTHSLYMIQRVNDAFSKLPKSDQVVVDELLEQTGWQPIRTAATHRRMHKSDFKLELEPRE